MFRNIVNICTFCFLTCSLAEDPLVEDFPQQASPAVKVVLEEAIEKFVEKGRLAGTKDPVPENELLKRHHDLLAKLNVIIDLMKQPTNIYKFIESKGMERVILPYIKLYYMELRSGLLDLTKMLFETAPTTTSVMAPIGLLDKLLEVFEEEVNLPLKAKVIDILSMWLPDNPKMQARVMKQKGLEPFYEEADKLDGSTIHTLLTLFNKIIKEHIQARDEKMQKTKSDLIKGNIYKSIHLLDRLATKPICNGLLVVYQSMWAYSLNNKEYMVPIFELMKNVQPYCEGFYVGRKKALGLFEDLKTQVMPGGDSRVDYENLGLNVTDLEAVLQRYIVKIESKDEL